MMSAMSTVPKKLYKYCSLRGEAFRFTQSIFARNSVYLSRVDAFNDPFEGHFRLVMPPNASEEQQRYETWANQLQNKSVQREAAILADHRTPVRILEARQVPDAFAVEICDWDQR